MAENLSAWASDFWTELRRIDPSWDVLELLARKKDHRLVIEDLGNGRGTLVAARKIDGHYAVIARHPFVLADPAKTVAAELIYLTGLPHHDSAIDAMCKDDFLRALRRAAEESDDALQVRQKMERWARHLLPYLERDPKLTVADALALYQRETGG